MEYIFQTTTFDDFCAFFFIIYKKTIFWAFLYKVKLKIN